MSSPDDTWRELLRGLSTQHPLHTLPTRLGVARNGACWEFARLPPLVATPRFFEGAATWALQAHHRACFWGLTADRLADGEAEGVEAWEVDALFEAWRGALTTGLGEAVAGALAAHAGSLQREGFALERHLLSCDAVSFEDWARCVSLRTAWFNASTLTALPAAERPEVERGLQHLMLGLQLLDDVVDAADDLSRRGASWPHLLGWSTDDMVSRSTALTVFAAQCFSGAGHRLLGAWCGTRATQVLAHYGLKETSSPSRWAGPLYWSAA